MLEAVGIGVITNAATALLRRSLTWGSDETELSQRFETAVADAVARHHAYVVNWSSEFHTLEGRRDAHADTVGLRFATIPRRLRSADAVAGELDESDLIVDPRHVAITGDPGSGKTTTLRRVANQITTEAPTGAADDFQFAVLVVCREERWDKATLVELLSSRVGIAGKLADDLDDPLGRLVDVLNLGAIVLIDGVDEVGSTHRQDLMASIEQMGRHLTNAKLLVTCRSADYRHLEGFTEAEILPLSTVQIRAAVENVLGDEAEEFYDTIESPEHPAMELAQRPLFLSQMAVIYRLQGEVPRRPSDLCHSIVQLVLRDWDEQRRVRRKSQYAGFSVHEKERFLADLSLELLRSDNQWFMNDQIVSAYRKVAPAFELPKSEATEVAKEIESHTGLLVRRGVGHQFSHLSLQEYLAATSFVSSSDAVRNAWWEFPPSVTAIAVALSSSGSDFLVERLRQLPPGSFDGPHRGVVASLLHRMASERPRLTPSRELGSALLHALHDQRVEGAELGMRLSSLESLAESVVKALRSRPLTSANNFTLIHPQSEYQSPMRVDSDLLRALIGPEAFGRLVRSKS